MADSLVFTHFFKGSEVTYRKGFNRTSYLEISSIRRCSFCLSHSRDRLAHQPSYSFYPRLRESYVPRGVWKKFATADIESIGRKKLFFSSSGAADRNKFRLHAVVDVAAAVDVINDLGMDTLTFLGVTVLIVPALRALKASPILGFFFAGVVLNQFGLIRNLTDVKILSEWGILFLLFEMGLELSLARLKALAKFAFGMGFPQVLLVKPSGFLQMLPFF